MSLSVFQATRQMARARANSPQGDFSLVAIQINATGNRVMDGTIQIGACSDLWQYDQYVLPYKRITHRTKYSLNLRINFDDKGDRVLIKTDTNLTLETMSEIEAMVGFLNWLENYVPKKEGIILMYHDRSNVMPMLIMDRMKRYNLIRRFLSNVKGFLNISYIRDPVTGMNFRQRNIHEVSKFLRYEAGPITKDARVRSEAIYEIVDELLNGNHAKILSEINDDIPHPEGAKEMREMCANIQISLQDDKVRNLVQLYGRSTHTVNQNLIYLTSILRRQNEYRFVFKGLFDFSFGVRKRTLVLRNKLVSNNIHFHHVRGCWLQHGRVGLERLFSRIYSLLPDDITFLVNIFDCFFDHRKLPLDVTMERARQNYWAKRQRQLRQLR